LAVAHDGVVSSPSLFRNISVLTPRKATAEFVVPKSIPMDFAISRNSSLFALRGAVSDNVEDYQKLAKLLFHADAPKWGSCHAKKENNRINFDCNSASFFLFQITMRNVDLLIILKKRSFLLSTGT
jgi:hypothetical protein